MDSELYHFCASRCAACLIHIILTVNLLNNESLQRVQSVGRKVLGVCVVCVHVFLRGFFSFFFSNILCYFFIF
jgi:hypothetical protein